MEYCYSSLRIFVMNKVKVAAALLAGTMLVSPALAADISGYVGASTDYIWRGNTQSDGDASLSGGIDVDFGNGFAVGTAVASLGRDEDTNGDSANYELDFYGSYSNTIGSVDYEVGYIAYEYPGVGNSDEDFADVYVSLGLGPLSVSYYMLASAENALNDANDGTYLSLDAEFPVLTDWTLGVHYGEESGDILQSDEDVAISLSKGAMTLTVSGDDGDDTRAIVSWGASF
jgi:uncharacterized protein (TIGR02001 family)